MIPEVQKHGWKVEDVLLTVNGQKILNFDNLKFHISNIVSNKIFPATFGVYREHKF